MFQLPEGQPRLLIEGVEHIGLHEIPGVKLNLNAADLALEVVLPATTFRAQTIDLASPPHKAEIPSQRRSALLDYRLGVSGGSGSSEQAVSLLTDASIASGRWLFRNIAFSTVNGSLRSNDRLSTQLIGEDRENLRQWLLGDLVAQGRGFAAGLSLGGVGVVRNYGLSPYLVRQPTFGMRGEALYPSTVDFYVGDLLVSRQNVRPGPFDIQNFNYYGGQRQVSVVIRDPFGREQRIDQSYFFTDQGLAEGLHEYGYLIGTVRESEVGAGEYGKLGYSAHHAYGATDRVTLGAYSQGTRERQIAGVSLILRNQTLGISNVELGHDRKQDGKGTAAWAINHLYQQGNFYAALALRGHGRGFQQSVVQGSPEELPKQEVTFSVGLSRFGWGSVSILGERERFHDGTRKTLATVSLSKPLGKGLNLLGVFRRYQGGATAGTELFVGLQYSPGRNINAGVSHSRNRDKSTQETLQASRTTPVGEGVGYGVSLTRSATPDIASVAIGGTTWQLNPRVTWNLPAATLIFEGGAERTAENQRNHRYSLAVAGSLVALPGFSGFSRPIQDSFALVDLGVPVPGVRVYENHQEVGRTNDQGRILLPNLLSYYNNYIAINDKDLPIDFLLGDPHRVIAPSSRSGSVIDFKMSRLTAVSGLLQIRRDGVLQPLANVGGLVRVAGKDVLFATGNDGKFYLEGLGPGSYDAQVQGKGGRCDFRLVVPANPDPVIRLVDLEVCNARP